MFRDSRKGEIKFTNLVRDRNLLAILGCMLMIRGGRVFERCREEQVGCEETIFSLPLSTLPYGNILPIKTNVHIGEMKIGRFILGVCCLIALNLWFNRRHKKTPTYSNTIGLTEAVSWPLVLLITVHFLCDLVPMNYSWLNLKTAQIVYLIVLCHFLTTAISSSITNAFKAQFHIWVLSLGMILGDGFMLNLVFFVLVITYSRSFVRHGIRNVFLLLKNLDPVKMALLFCLLGSHGFFSFGHQTSIAMIPWHAAFIGIPGNFFVKILPAFLIFLHLYAGRFLSIFSIFIDDDHSSIDHKTSSSRHLKHFTSLIILLLSAIKVNLTK